MVNTLNKNFLRFPWELSVFFIEKTGKLQLTPLVYHIWIYILSKNLPRSSRPSRSSTEVNITKVKEMVTDNCHLSLREIAPERSVSHESIHTTLKDFWKENSWILHHDNAPSHKAIIVNKFLAIKTQRNHWTTTVFTLYGSGRIFSLYKTQITISRHPFSVDRRHKREFMARTEVDPRKCV